MSEQRTPVTVVNHVAIEIAVPPDVLWATIQDTYVSGQKFAAGGYRIEPLEDPSAPLGGYRMTLEQDGAVADERICLITEYDHAARRLSLSADYLSVPGGLKVYVTYQAQPAGKGTRYLLDCHTPMTVETETGSASEVAAAAARMKADFDTHLNDFLSRTKAQLEAAG